jgi:hypothetical protein
MHGVTRRRCGICVRCCPAVATLLAAGAQALVAGTPPQQLPALGCLHRQRLALCVACYWCTGVAMVAWLLRVRGLASPGVTRLCGAAVAVLRRFLVGHLVACVSRRLQADTIADKRCTTAAWTTRVGIRWASGGKYVAACSSPVLCAPRGCMSSAVLGSVDHCGMGEATSTRSPTVQGALETIAMHVKHCRGAPGASAAVHTYARLGNQACSLTLSCHMVTACPEVAAAGMPSWGWRP